MDYNVTFHNNDGKLIGEFNFSGDRATFVGDVDESARKFVDFVLSYYEETNKKSNDMKLDMIKNALLQCHEGLKNREHCDALENRLRQDIEDILDIHY